jgi:hypothetical protein
MRFLMGERMAGKCLRPIIILICASFLAVSCTSRHAPVSLVGTWKNNRLVYMFDTDGSCTLIDLGNAGTYQNGKYKVAGDHLDISFDSGQGLQYTFHPLKSGNLQVSDVITKNSFEFIKER